MVIFHKIKSIGYLLRARHVSDRFSVVKKQDWMKDLSFCYVDKQRKNLRPCSGIQETSCCRLVTKLCLTLCKPMDCCLPGSSVHGISQARILEWVAISFSRGSSWPRNWTCVSLTGRQIFYHWSTREALEGCRKPRKCIREHAGKWSGNQILQLLYLGRVAVMMNLKIKSFH